MKVIYGTDSIRSWRTRRTVPSYPLGAKCIGRETAYDPTIEEWTRKQVLLNEQNANEKN